MNLFSPYQMEIHSSSELHIRETATRRRFLFFFFRIFPFIILALGWRVISIEDLPNEFKYVLGPLILLIALLLFFKTYTTGVKVSGQIIELKIQKFFSETSHTIHVNDIDKLVVIERHGRGGGYFYKIRMKGGSKVTFFTIPVLYMRAGKLQQINEVLNKITSIKVEKT